MVSPVDTVIAATKPEADDNPQLLALAAQIQHNLEYQHRWTNLKLHKISSITGNKFPRPLISGLPPKRIYVNPDEQIDILRREVKNESNSTSQELDPEYEWVLPTHINEEWSLKSLAEIFELVEHIPGQPTPTKWRQIKRVLMGILQNDSAIVYYFSHDGIVKPRQN
jgi:tRNA-splicing endonuclease subunit Sen15